MPKQFTALLATAALLLSSFATAENSQDLEHINDLLDDLHRAAAEADEDRYLGHFAPDAVFMGTDDWERWPLPEFRKYVAGRFAGGTGWTYHPRNRFVTFAADGQTAWFDEIVESPRWGRFRGTGVVRQVKGEWLVAHYSLTLLVPNERFADTSAVALEGFEARDAQAAEEQ